MNGNNIEVYLSNDKCCICAISCINDRVSLRCYEYELNTPDCLKREIHNATKPSMQFFVKSMKKIIEEQEITLIYSLRLNAGDFKAFTSALTPSSECSNRQKIINAFSSINQLVELPEEEEYEAYSACSIS